MSSIQNLKSNIIEKGREIIDSGFVVGTWGNISAKIPQKNIFAITPSGIDYKNLNTDDIVIVDGEENIVEGKRKPSSELKMHLEIYKNRTDVNSIIHTHSTYATTFAAARKPIPEVVEDLVQIVGGKVEVSDYALPGSVELGKNAVEALNKKGAVLLANHGVVSAGKDLDEALQISQVVEKSAQIAISAQLLGGAVKLSEEDVSFMRSFYVNQYGQK